MRTRVNDIEIAYTDEGSGTPLLLVHGFPLDRTMWDDQLRALSSHYRVIAPDLRGHGESEAVAGPYTMDLLADDLKALLDNLNVGQVVLGAFSMGGYVAFAFHRRYKERVQALVLADTRPQPDTPQAAEGRETLAQRAEAEGQAPIAEALLPRLLTPDTLQSQPGIVEHVRTMITRCSVAGIAGDLRAIATRPDSTKTLEQITCPTLVLVGEEDALTPPADSELMADRIPGARLQVIPSAAHLSNLENPDTFNFALLSFLEGL